MNHENHPHYPEEYKIWEVEFFGKKFFVTPDVLIPRLETEALVRRARKILQENSFANFTDKNQTFKWKIFQKQYFQGDEDFSKEVYKNVNDWEKSEINTENSSFSKIFDIGSGSGIIGTSIADLGEEIIFVDISANALQIAKRNFLRNFSDFTEISDKNSVQNFSKNPETETVFTRNFQKIHFIESDLLENIDFEKIYPHGKILQKQYFQGDEDFSKEVYKNTNDWEPYKSINSRNWNYEKNSFALDGETKIKEAKQPKINTKNSSFQGIFQEKILILSNLPYIKNGDWENMSEDTIFEPKLALFGGEKTGFELYEKLFSQIIAKKLHGTMIIEFGFDQRKIAEEIFVKNFPHWKVTFFADFAGIERFAEIEF